MHIYLQFLTSFTNPVKKKDLSLLRRKQVVLSTLVMRYTRITSKLKIGFLEISLS